MLKDLILLVKNSSWYLIGNFTSTFLGVLLLPLYTRFLTPSDYGIIAIAASVTGFLAAFYHLGLLAAYGRFYFEYKDDPEELNIDDCIVPQFLWAYPYTIACCLWQADCGTYPGCFL
jgi:O-antigen/teichoic acid export membrane protein